MQSDSLNVIIPNVMDSHSAIFYQSPEFWINFFIGSCGLLFSILAFKEARSAKVAASAAGMTVKIQTITIELTEMLQSLDSLDMNISFKQARDLVNQINRKVRRMTAPFAKHNDYREKIEATLQELDLLKKNLNSVKPTDESNLENSGYGIYYAIEGNLANLNGLISELIGIFEKRTIENL